MPLSDEDATKLQSDLTAATTARDNLQRERDAVVVERDTLGAKLKDFDTVKAQHAEYGEQLKELATIKADRERLAGEVDKFVKRDREGAIVSGLMSKAPGLTQFDAEAAVAKLHEKGAINRHGEKADEEVGKALEALKTLAPNFGTRTALSGGGGEHGKKPAATPAARNLIG